MDSLGSKHLQACKQLSRYLLLEAKDKKDVDSKADIRTKQVNVSVHSLIYSADE